MAYFKYTARSRTGEKASGRVKAPTKAAAIKEVERMGLFPVTIVPVDQSGSDAGRDDVPAPATAAPDDATIEEHAAKTIGGSISNYVKAFFGTLFGFLLVAAAKDIFKSCSQESASKETGTSYEQRPGGLTFRRADDSVESESSPKNPTRLEPQSARGALRHADPIYTDKINGYFTVIPPSGWKQQDYPSETIRSKVRFNHPRLNEVNVTIIAGPNPQSSSSLDDLLTSKQNNAAELKAKFPRGSFTVSKEKVGDREAVLVKTSMSGAEQKLVFFVNNSIQYNVGLSATSKREYESLAETFQQFLNSFTMLESGREFSDAEAKAAVISGCKRRAELWEQRGDIPEALAAVETGLRVDPSNMELLDVQIRLTKKRR